jgi:hypothetical protein
MISEILVVFGIFLCSHTAQYNVPVGNKPAQFAVCRADRKGTDVVPGEQARCNSRGFLL